MNYILIDCFIKRFPGLSGRNKKVLGGIAVIQARNAHCPNQGSAGIGELEGISQILDVF